MNRIGGFLAGGALGASGFGAAAQAVSTLGSLSCAASLQGDSILRSLEGSLGQSSPAQGVSAAGIESLLRAGLGWLSGLLGGGAGGAAAGGLAGEAVQLALPLAL